jgi:hypothetical protein
MIGISQNMALVETMAPLMQDTQYQTRGVLCDTVLKDIQWKISQNPEEIAHTIQESESEGSVDLPKGPSETAVEETPQKTVQNISEQQPEDHAQQLPKDISVPKSIVPIHEDLSCLGQVTFDPSKHIQFTPPSKIWTMKELEYPENQ